MSPDWNAIRLDLVGLDEPTRASLRAMRPFFASALPDILARFYDKVRQYDPSCGILADGAMQEAVRMQLQHWNLIGGGDFGLPYLSSVARFCEFNRRAGVAPQWYIGCRLMFVAGQLIAAVETQVQIARVGEPAQAAQDRKAAMVKAIAKANMLDTEHVMDYCFGANRQLSEGVHHSDAASRQPLSIAAAQVSSDSKQGFGGAQARANACRPLNVSRLGSLTPAR
jgi:hypothetical protein